METGHGHQTALSSERIRNKLAGSVLLGDGWREAYRGGSSDETKKRMRGGQQQSSKACFALFLLPRMVLFMPSTPVCVTRKAGASRFDPRCQHQCHGITFDPQFSLVEDLLGIALSLLLSTYLQTATCNAWIQQHNTDAPGNRQHTRQSCSFAPQILTLIHVSSSFLFRRSPSPRHVSLGSIL